MILGYILELTPKGYRLFFEKWSREFDSFGWSTVRLLLLGMDGDMEQDTFVGSWE